MYLLLSAERKKIWRCNKIMKQRIITAIVLIALFVPCLVLGGIPFALLMVFMGCMSTFELLSICNHPKAKIYLYPLIGLYLLLSLLLPSTLLVPSEYIMLFLLILVICGVFDASMSMNRLSYYFMASTLVAFGIHMTYHMRMNLSVYYLVLLAFATLGADTGAYFAGRTFGKHKLNVRLSPNKTVEGSIGGIILGGLLGSAYGILMKLSLPIYIIIMISFVLASTGQIGDLTFSSIKRTFEVKDYSQIFPGHGGVLDRFDSIIFNAMVLGILLHYLPLLFNFKI